MNKNGIKAAIITGLISFVGGLGTLGAEMGTTIMDIKTLPLAGLCAILVTALTVGWQSYRARVTPADNEITKL